MLKSVDEVLTSSAPPPKWLSQLVKKADVKLPNKGSINSTPPPVWLTDLLKNKKDKIDILDEVLSADSPASKWISDFVKSKNKKFKGKTKQERIDMALAAYYAKKNNR